ncbi:MAG: hypothetical protein KJS92_07280 [Bacteroidetes bacterium]|nr:hypothetical protein [Bacteroidota bacterium]
MAYISAGMAMLLAACFFLLIHSCRPDHTTQDGTQGQQQAKSLPEPAALGSVLYEDLLDPLFIAAGISSGYQLKGDGIPAILISDSARVRLMAVPKVNNCTELNRLHGASLARQRNWLDSSIKQAVLALKNLNRQWLDSASAWYKPLINDYKSGRINQETLGSRLLQLNGQVRDSMRNDADRQRVSSNIRKNYETYLLKVKQSLSEQEWQDWVKCCIRQNEER